jgi:hypothetical protein
MIPVGDYRYERIHPTGEPPCWVLFPTNASAARRCQTGALPFEVCDKHRMEFIVETGVQAMDCPRCRFEVLEKEQVKKVRQMALDQSANEAARERFDTILRRDGKVLCIIGLVTLALLIGVSLMRLTDQGTAEFQSWQAENARAASQ